MRSRKTTRPGEQLETVMSLLLRAGVIAAAALVLSGGGYYLTQHGLETPDYRVFHGEPADLRSPLGTAAAAISLDSRAIIQLGLLILIMTPVSRVAFSVVAFASHRDRLYLAITLLVLAVLLYNLLGPHR